MAKDRYKKVTGPCGKALLENPVWACLHRRLLAPAACYNIRLSRRELDRQGLSSCIVSGQFQGMLGSVLLVLVCVLHVVIYKNDLGSSVSKHSTAFFQKSAEEGEVVCVYLRYCVTAFSTAREAAS